MTESEKIVREINGHPSNIKIFKKGREYLQIIYFGEKYWRDLNGVDLNYLIKDAKELMRSKSLDLSDLDFDCSGFTEEFISKGIVVWDSDDEL